MKQQEREQKPLVIVDGSGRIVDVAVMNRKSFTKSTEHGRLWVVHEETARVLPYEAARRTTNLVDRGGWYEATVEAAADEPGRSAPSNGAPPREERSADRRGADEARAASEAAGKGTTADPGPVLRELVEVIRQRRRERPEGSYTTYLFDAGEEKIRKKTGEEAIELVLARKREEVVSETADLIYHLLVLLNELDIPLDEVFGELARRR